jgi:hypothetical protein
VSAWNGQAGRGGLGLIVVLVVLAVGGYLAWGSVHQAPAPPATRSAAAAASGQQKALAFAEASALAQKTGRPVRVVETFDDAELSALANQAAEARSMPVDQISLHATGHGTVQGQAQAHMAGQSVPVTLEGVPQVSNSRVTLNVTSTHVGAIPLPGAMSDQLAASIKQPLALGEPISGFQDLHVAVAEGQLTVSGVAQPS